MHPLVLIHVVKQEKPNFASLSQEADGSPQLIGFSKKKATNPEGFSNCFIYNALHTPKIQLGYYSAFNSLTNILALIVLL